MPQKRGGLGALWKLMAPYLLEHRWKLLLIIVLVVVSNLLLLLIPSYTGKIVDAAGLGAGKVDFGAILRFSGVILLLSLFGWGLECARNALMVRVSQAIVYKLRQTVFRHLLHLPLAFLEANTKGDIISRISVDIDQISETITSDAITVLTGVVTVVGALAMMLSLSPPMTLIFAVMLPLIVLTARFISQKARRRFHEKKIRFAALCSHAEEMITAQKTVKLFGLESYNEGIYENLSENYRAGAQSAEFCSSTMMPTMNFYNNLSFLLISLLGCFLFLQGRISIGNISSFIVYSKKFTAPVVETANLYGTFQSALASCDRINYLLAQPEEHDREKLAEPSALRGDIVFDHVGFCYEKDVPVVRDLSFRVRAGEKVAIVGETGAGKTTLMSLLLRFFEPDEGKITIDGIDVRDLPLSFLRRSFALVLQENFLFEMSIADNVDYAAECRDRERIEAAVRAVELDDFVQSLPEGYDTVLASDSGLFSQGQKQLLTIARAILANPTMFIFDEATSSVDTLTEEKIKAVTERVMRGKTSFIIAHRLSTIRSADLILVMEHGRIIEQGTHEQLLERGGVYAEMYHSQFVPV